MENFIVLDHTNIENEHICCGFSDKKCVEGYELKKDWLKQAFDNGYTFYRLNERAKVFIEYGPIENAWLPIEGENFLNINCFWVSGKYKNQGYGIKLLEKAIEDAKRLDKLGLVTVVGKKKYHFMSEGKWFLKNGFKVVDETNHGFVLLMMPLKEIIVHPTFKAQTKEMTIDYGADISIYYSYRCPFTQYYVETVLRETLSNKNISFELKKIETLEDAKLSPTPATIFSMYYKGKFLTTDISMCLESKFEKCLQTHLSNQ